MDDNKDNNNKNSSVYRILKILLIMILTSLITCIVTIRLVRRSYLNASGMTYLSTKLGIIRNKLDKEYVGDLNEDEMLEAAVKGYVNGVGDKYTEYYNEKEMKEFLETTEGSYVGIGVYIAQASKENKIIIINVIEGSSAEEAGLKAGDYIKSVDNVEYSGEELSKVSAALKGKDEGTEAKVVVIRDSEELEYYVKRKRIRVKSVASDVVKDNIGYIKIATFSENTSEEFKTEYQNLKNQNITALIIDLRNNGGGLVSESLKIAETMVDVDKVMLITSNKQNKEKEEKSRNVPIVDVPVVILINEYSASASEILAGCLKEDCGYKVVGKTSYGKGVIQNVYSFPDGSGMKVTTEEYFTPKHNKINKVGIIPDIEISMGEEWEKYANVPFENDAQLQAAVEELSK